MNKPWLSDALIFLQPHPSFFSRSLVQMYSVGCFIFFFICMTFPVICQLYTGPTVSERQSKQLHTALELQKLQRFISI